MRGTKLPPECTQYTYERPPLAPISLDDPHLHAVPNQVRMPVRDLALPTNQCSHARFPRHPLTCFAGKVGVAAAGASWTDQDGFWGGWGGAMENIFHSAGVLSAGYALGRNAGVDIFGGGGLVLGAEIFRPRGGWTCYLQKSRGGLVGPPSTGAFRFIRIRGKAGPISGTARSPSGRPMSPCPIPFRDGGLFRFSYMPAMGTVMVTMVMTVAAMFPALGMVRFLC